MGEKLSSWKHLSVNFLCSSWLAVLGMVQAKQEKRSCSSHHPQNLPCVVLPNKKKNIQDPSLQMHFLSERGWGSVRTSVKYLQPAPLISSHLFSPPTLGACRHLCVDTQSLNQQPPPSSSIMPGERLRGAVGEVTGTIPTLWLFYTYVKGRGVMDFLSAVQ